MKRDTNIIARAIGITAVVLSIVGGVTFGTLQSQAALLKGNTIQTAIASLQLSGDGTNYSSQLEGYNFGNLVPGGQAQPTNGYPIYLKNVGTTPLAIKLSVASGFSNPNNVDLSKVHVILSPSAGTPQNMTLADLIAANTTGGIAITAGGASRVLPSQGTFFTAQVSLESDAVNGPSASIGNLDFTFGAVATN